MTEFGLHIRKLSFQSSLFMLFCMIPKVEKKVEGNDGLNQSPKNLDFLLASGIAKNS